MRNFPLLLHILRAFNWHDQTLEKRWPVLMACVCLCVCLRSLYIFVCDMCASPRLFSPRVKGLLDSCVAFFVFTNLLWYIFAQDCADNSFRVQMMSGREDMCLWILFFECVVAQWNETPRSLEQRASHSWQTTHTYAYQTPPWYTHKEGNMKSMCRCRPSE